MDVGGGAIRSKAISLANEEFYIAWDFERSVSKLRMSVAMMGAFLMDLEDHQGTSMVFREWVKNISYVANEGRIILDLIDYEGLRHQQETRGKLSDFFSVHNPVVFRLVIGQKLKQMSKMMTDIEKIATRFKIYTLPIRQEMFQAENVAKVVHPLQSNFNNLTPEIKACVAYCSTLHKSYVIDREWLVQMWMAEGLLGSPSEATHLEDVARTYIDILIAASLFEDVEKDSYGDIVSFRVSNYVTDTISYYNNYATTRVLQVEFGLDRLSRPIRELKHIRYLNISCPIACRTLPEVITKLYLLITLKLKTGESLGKSLNNLRNLVQLRQLLVERYSPIPFLECSMPTFMGKMTTLQLLSFFVVGAEEGRGIEELGSLHNLGGDLAIGHLERVGGGEVASKANIIGKEKLRRVEFVWGERSVISNTSSQDKVVLENLQPHQNVKGLSIVNYEDVKFPEWVRKMIGLVNLVEVVLRRSKKCEDIPMLGHLKHLKILEISELSEVKYIGGISNQFYGERTILMDRNTEKFLAFPALKKFNLEKMSGLLQWKGLHEVDDIIDNNNKNFTTFFPCLEALVVCECPLLEMFPICDPSAYKFPSLKILEISQIRSSSPFLWESLKKITTLTSIKIEYVTEGLSSLPLELLHNNINLEYIYMGAVSKLVDFTQGSDYELGLKDGIFLTTLKLVGCPNLKGLAGQPETLSFLERLFIKDCSTLVTISTRGMASLMTLDIRDCPCLVAVSDLRCCLNLQFLTIEECLKLTYLGEQGCLGYLPMLQTLSSGAFSEELHFLPSFNCSPMVEKHSLPFKSLKLLSLSGWENLESIPAEFQYATQLKFLTIKGFDGITELPAWMENFCLRTVEISSCKILNSIPQFKVQKKNLRVKYCPGLPS